MATEEGLSRSGSAKPVPTPTVRRVLRNRVYSGNFEWAAGCTAERMPLVTRELWSAVQQALGQRLASREKEKEHSFAFSGLVACGHCGCALVGEIEKGQYVYCTGFKGKCSEPYTHREVLEEEGSLSLRTRAIDQGLVDWVANALHQSDVAEQRHHKDVTARLRTNHERLQKCLDMMCEDRLDSRIDLAFSQTTAPTASGRPRTEPRCQRAPANHTNRARRRNQSIGRKPVRETGASTCMALPAGTSRPVF
jgi:hypothetical protein